MKRTFLEMGNDFGDREEIAVLKRHRVRRMQGVKGSRKCEGRRVVRVSLYIRWFRERGDRLWSSIFLLASPEVEFVAGKGMVYGDVRIITQH